MLKIKVLLKNFFPFLLILKIKLKYLFLHIFYFLPIKGDQFFFDSYFGRSYSCNPKYLYKYFLEKGIAQKDNCFWNKMKNASGFGEDVLEQNCVITGSLNAIKKVMTSKVIIVNTSLPSYIPIRKSQIVINTWHGGGAYKHSGLDNPDEKTSVMVLKSKLHKKQTKYFLTSSKRFADAVSTGQLVEEKQRLPVGMPRNDMLINHSYDERELRKKFNFDSEALLVLYAPTYRHQLAHDDTDYSFDFNLIKGTLEKKFNRPVVFLYRAHRYFIGETDFKNVIDVTEIPDMQELLAVSDILITDYSSCIWDFCLTKKPCFLYCSDLYQYSTDRSFYTPIEKWGVSFATNNKDFVHNILSFDKDVYELSLNSMFTYFENYDCGNASEKIGEMIKQCL